MKQVVESYVALWIIMLIFMLALAFTSINMNVAQARKIASDIKAEIQASNGQIVPESNFLEYIGNQTIKDDGFAWKSQIERQTIVNQAQKEDSESYIYNSIYKISVEYTYSVPLFGKQVYPIVTFAY